MHRVYLSSPWKGACPHSHPAKINRHTEPRSKFNRAATLTRNTRERDLLLKRPLDCSQSLSID
jgi:hypothetical protein